MKHQLFQSELNMTEMVKWYKLGVLLKLDTNNLDAINEMKSDTDVKILKMFELWMTTNPTLQKRSYRDALEENYW